MKKREKYIDIARAIAIIMVVMGHCNNFAEGFNIERFSGLFFIPLFIFISGYFSNENKINTFKELLNHLKNKILKLYFFYLRWELLFLVLTNVFFYIGFFNNNIVYGGKTILPIESIGEFFHKVINIIFFMGREPFCGAFWFIISLIFIIFGHSIINYLINKFFNKKSIKFKQLVIGVIVLICFIIGCIMSKTINIQRVSPAFTLMLFYYLGYLANYYKEKIRFNNIWIALLCLASLIVLYNIGSVGMNANTFPNGLFLIASSLSGIYFVIYISKLLEKIPIISNIFSYIGKNTLPIIALHFVSFKLIMYLQLLFGVIKYEDMAYLTGYNNANWWYILYVIAGVGVPLLYDFIMKIINNKLRLFYKNITNKGV